MIVLSDTSLIRAGRLVREDQNSYTLYLCYTYNIANREHRKILIQLRLKLLYQFYETIIKCVWLWIARNKDGNGLQLENIRPIFSSFPFVSWQN